MGEWPRPAWKYNVVCLSGRRKRKFPNLTLRIVTVTVTTVTCSSAPPLQSDRWRIPEFTQCSRCAAWNRKLFSLLLYEAVERKSFKSVGSRFQARGHECGNGESPVTSLPTRSWYDKVTDTRRTQRQPWRNVRGGRQQAGNVIGSVPDEHLVQSRYSLYCSLSVIGNQCNSRKAGVTWSPSFKSITARAAAYKTVEGLVSSPANPQEQHCSGQGAIATKL